MAQKAFDEAVRFVPFSAKRKPADWVKGLKHRILGHPLLAQLLHIQVVKGEVALYDQIVLIERGGSVTMVVDKSTGKILFTIQRRPVLKVKDWSKWKEMEPEDLGRDSLEFPRGFREDGESGSMAAIREAFEEAGVEITPETQCTQLGDIVANTTFLGQYVEVYLMEIDSNQIRDINPDAYESFVGAAKWLSLQEIWVLIRKGDFYDSMSQAVLGQYLLKLHIEQSQARTALAAQA